MSFKKQNIHGFSLIELMVVIGMLGGLSLVMMNLTKESTKSSSKYQFDSEVMLITNEINGILSDPNKCLTTFTNATQAASPSSPVLNATPANILNPSSISGIPSTTKKYSITGGPYGNGGVKIASYSLDLASTPDPLLTISFEKKLIQGAGTIPKSIKLYVEKNAAGVITLCRSISTSSTEIWSHGLGSDIFYSGGIRVGDQTQATACNASAEGTQRYNKTIHSMEYCGYNAGPPVTYSWMGIGAGGGGLGVGQTWQNVLPSRAFGTTYTNSTTSPIEISATVQVCSGSTSFSVLRINGIITGQSGKSAANADRYQLTGVVPQSGTYSISTSSGVMCLVNWAELR